MSGTVDKRYLFFLRSYNDVDNVAPAIYFLLEKEKKTEAHIIFYSFDYAFKQNPNLLYLKEIFGKRIRVEWLGDKAGINYDKLYNYGAFSKLYLTLHKLNPKRRITHLPAPTDGFPEVGRQSIIDDILSDGPFPSLVVFDQNRAHAVGGLTNCLRNGGVQKIISLPVSPFINTSVFRASDFINFDPAHRKLKHDYSHLDTVVLCDDFYAKRLKKFYSLLGEPSPLDGKVHVLGSLRFCPEWLEIRKNIIPPNPIKRAKKKINLVFMLSNPATNTNWNEIKATIQLLGEFPDIGVIIKPHTRNKKVDLGKLPQNVSLDFASESSDLINWSDVVMFWGTSVALEGYLKDKTCICLNHVHANINNYAQHDAGWIINSRDELVEALFQLNFEPMKKPYDLKKVDIMIEQLVYGGDKKQSVPEKYIQYFEEEGA